MITPQTTEKAVAQALALKSVVFKREDLHPYGSHKGRSIPYMIDEKIKTSCRHFAISSSGNAALSAAMYVKELNDKREDKITLEVLVGKNINTQKLEKLSSLQDHNILISSQERPLQALFIKTQDPSIQSLRQSTDDTALIGYKSLADELMTISDLQAIFMGTSSGTTLQALAERFADVGRMIEIHAVQTSSCHPIAETLVDVDMIDEKSLADAIVDQTALRKKKLVDLIKESGGSAWIAKNTEIISAQELVTQNTDITISPNSALSVAGLMQATYTGKTWEGTVVCMICGN